MRLHFVINDEIRLWPHTHVNAEHGLMSASTPSSTTTHEATNTSSIQGQPPTRTDTPSTMSQDLVDVTPSVANSQTTMASDHMQEATELRDPVNAVFNIVSCTQCRCFFKANTL